MSLRGISVVVLGYSHLDSGAARAQVGKVSLFSDFVEGLAQSPGSCRSRIVREVVLAG